MGIVHFRQFTYKNGITVLPGFTYCLLKSLTNRHLAVTNYTLLPLKIQGNLYWEQINNRPVWDQGSQAPNLLL